MTTKFNKREITMEVTAGVISFSNFKMTSGFYFQNGLSLEMVVRLLRVRAEEQGYGPGITKVISQWEHLPCKLVA